MDRDEIELSFECIGTSYDILHKFDESADKIGAPVNRWFLKSEIIPPKTYIKSVQFEQEKNHS